LRSRMVVERSDPWKMWSSSSYAVFWRRKQWT
jgi:hypothetical protein